MKITKPEIPKSPCQGKIRGNTTIEKQNKGKRKKREGGEIKNNKKKEKKF